MLSTLLSTALAAAGLLQQIDSTLPVERGQRLAVNAFAGEVVVTAWDRNEVQVRSDQVGGRSRVEITRTGASVEVRTHGRRGPAGSVDLQVSAPAWMPVDVSGVHTDVQVSGIRAPIRVETVQGEITVDGGVDRVSLESVEGRISLRNAKGRIEVSSVNEDVVIAASSGEVAAETVNGEVVLEQVDATGLAASTVNGDIGYDGPFRAGGRYALSTHNGDLTLAVGPNTSAAVTVSTFNGEFESDFPVALTETRKGRRFSFTLGSGSAQVSLESFQGSIRLVRPGTGSGRGNDERE